MPPTSFLAASPPDAYLCRARQTGAQPRQNRGLWKRDLSAFGTGREARLCPPTAFGIAFSTAAFASRTPSQAASCETDQSSGEIALSNASFDKLLQQEMLLRVVVEDTTSERIVVTVYKTAQLGKYLKGGAP
jgi:hypothetical protein